MCGIVGYIGPRDAYSEVYKGLIGLEYRGYDSCGIALLNEFSGDFEVFKRLGPPSENLAKTAASQSSKLALGHTRWATHGAANLINTHPHESRDGKFQLVHNGIIENYSKIKIKLEKKGYKFKSETDSEALVHLISYYYDKLNSLETALSKALPLIDGTFGMGLICRDEPKLLIAARRGSPVSIGTGDNGYYLTSDPTILPKDSTGVVILDDDRIAWIKEDSVRVQDFNEDQTPYIITTKFQWSDEAPTLNGYSCFMEKEIFEQPESIRRAIRGRVRFKNSEIKIPAIENIYPDKILIIGCGSAYHAGMIGKYYFEDISGIPTQVEVASEFNYRSVPKEENVLAIFISQSGETADTISALSKCKGMGYEVLTITNSICSTLARESGQGIYQYAGKEVSVASTKAFTSQVTILLMMAAYLGKMNPSFIGLIPDQVERILSDKKKILKIAKTLSKMKNIMFLGRQAMYPVALEASLKLKEISYLNSQAYPSGEIKHGPLALIEAYTPVILFATQEDLEGKNASTNNEIRSRGGQVVVVRKQNHEMPRPYDAEIIIPDCNDYVAPILVSVCFQLFALYVASNKNINIDKPRNLAKSVTVE